MPLNKGISQKEEGETFNFIIRLRVIAMFLVAWPHLGWNLNQNWKLLGLIQWFINRPLAIIQNFGALGVSIFYIISGFLLLNRKHTPFPYLKNRVVKIYLPVPLSMAIFFVIQKLFSIILRTETYWGNFSLKEWIYSAFLINYLHGLPDPVNGVLWYLFPLTLLYILYIIYTYAEHILKFPPPPPFFSFFVDIFVIISCTLFPKYPQIPLGLKNFPAYLCIPIFGVLIYFLWSNEISLFRFLGGAIFNYACMVYGFYVTSRPIYEGEPYLVSVLYGVLIFSIALLTEKYCGSVSQRTLWFSEISYSFYITHSLYGGMIISALFPYFPYTVCFLAGIVVSISMAYLNHRAIYGFLRPIHQKGN